MIKIAITGPESSGKSTLSKQLFDEFGGKLIEEFARTYLASKSGFYRKNDLDFMLQQQLNLKKRAELEKPLFIFSDTNSISFKIWSIYKYGDCSEFILNASKKSNYDLTFLLSPDLDYQSDPLRENSSLKERNELFELHLKELNFYGVNYEIINGSGKERIKKAITILRNKFSI